MRRLWLRRIKVWLRSRLWSATQVQPDLTNLSAPGPEHFKTHMINSVCVAPPCDAERLPNRWNATIATSGLSTAWWTSVLSSTGSEARRSLQCGRRVALMLKIFARGRPRGTALVHWSRPRCPRACTTAPTRLYLETVDDLPRRSLPNPVQIRMTLTNAKEGECTSSSKV